MTSDARRPSPLYVLIDAGVIDYGAGAEEDLANDALDALERAGYLVVPREDFLEVLSGIDHDAAQSEQDAAERLREFLNPTGKASQVSE